MVVGAPVISRSIGIRLTWLRAAYIHNTADLNQELNCVPRSEPIEKVSESPFFRGYRVLDGALHKRFYIGSDEFLPAIHLWLVWYVAQRLLG